jgi:3-hydroxyacyl-CoA dehydrogenase/enoyl-CoA hydratase/3-hydroxybutyryl-CoA epimerase
MVTGSNYKNWKMATDAKGNCWLTLDRQGSSANTLGKEVLEEFNSILTELNTNMPKGLVIQSGKSSGFIAGADISEFLEVQSVEEATAMVRVTQLIYERLAVLPCPTVAMINGFCLGGGLELSLACKYRVALDSPKTKIGLPEVMLGVQPGWGGSIRLPKLIGSLTALELIVAGRIVDARTAYKMGIVDASVPERQFKIAVEYYLSGAVAPKHCGSFEKFLQLPIIRPIVGKFFKYQIAKKVDERHYPAPFAVIDAWVRNSIYSPKAMQAEAESIGRLMVTPTARNLVRVFFLRDRLKGFAKAAKFAPKHVHVIGAGVMGGDIAAWCALNGFTVTVQDQSLPAIAATLNRAQQLFTKKLKLPYLVQAARDRLMPDTTGLGIPKADIIIEAIIENVQAKQELFAMLEARAKPEAVLASNTSTIPLATIGQNLKNPQRVVGIHFFNPVPLMQLVEVVADVNTDPQVVANAMAFVGKIDKLPLPVKSAPGFLVNRVLIPYLVESAALYAEGIPGPVIDRAATDFGMLMGPIELMDTVGLDICVSAGKSMGSPVPDFVEKMVKEGKLGKKSGEGFYKYKNGKVIKPSVDRDADIPDDVSDRLIMRIINESQACLREGIVSDADLVDAGLIFGAGFAPFRGGPMAYAADQQKANIKERLDKLASRYGDRFRPDPGWLT